MRITVFCGSKIPKPKEYIQASQELGTWLGQSRHTLVYGGSQTGLMGQVADACIQAGGSTIGVIPRVLDQLERNHPHLDRTIQVSSMSERKEKLFELGQAYIALPGGPGTLEEVADALSWARIGLHDHPCILYNIQGYYDKLIDFYQQMVDDEFIQRTDLDHLKICSSLTNIKDLLAPQNQSNEG